MIETRLFSAWDGVVGSIALIAIIVLGFYVMVRAVKPGDVLRHLGVIVGIVILLIMLPAIIMGLWHGMSFGQHFGIAVLLLVIVLIVSAAHRKSTKAQRSKRRWQP